MSGNDNELNVLNSESENSDTSASISGPSAIVTKQLPGAASKPANMQSAVLFSEYAPDSEDIGSYLDRFDCFTLVNGVADEKKAKFFIACVGPVVYQRLQLLAIPKKPMELTFKEIENLLRDEFKKKPLVHVARHNFRQRKQQPGESFRTFYNDLKKLSQDCEFLSSDILKEELKGQIISGIRDPKTQSFFFMQAKLTLEDVVKKAEIDEQAGDGVQHFRNGNSEHEKLSESNVHKLNDVVNRRKSYYPQPKSSSNFRGMQSRENENRPNRADSGNSSSSSAIVCYRCAQEGHKANVCRYRSASCAKCRRTGHISAACGQNRAFFRRPTPAAVHQIDDPYEVAPMASIADRDIDGYFVDEICNVSSRDPQEKVFVTLKIDDIPVVFEADSGSRFAIMSKRTFSKVGIQKPILACKIILKSFTGNFIFILGYVNVSVSYRNKNFANLRLLIADEDVDTVFGREWWFAIHFDIFENPVSEVKKLDVPFDLCQALKNAVTEFDDIFDDAFGTLKNVCERVNVKPDAKPIFCRHRNIVYALRDPVSNEIDRLIVAGVYVATNSSDWATPLVIVTKANKTVRLVGDYSVTVNRSIVAEDYPIPNIEEILYDFGSCTQYSKFDITEAYMHMEVDEDTAKLLTVNTPKGLFRVTRLNYGIQSAPAKWQRYVETVFKPVKGCRCFYDDIKISSATPQLHLASVLQFFRICRENGIKLRKSKCQLLTNQLDYLGFRVDAKGIHKTSEKVDAILKAPPPKNVTEVKSFTGLVVFYNRFLPDLSTMLHPINKLLRKETTFEWTKECQLAFDAVKKEIASPRVLCHFDPNKKIILATDASPYAVGAVLSHNFDEAERPIAFASRTLTRAEANYSQIDRESLAIYWGVKRFFNYLYGRQFILYVDCRPLQAIFSKNAARPALSATRLLHYAVYLQGFDYEIKYRRSEDHSNADFLSRFPVERGEENHIDEPSVVNINQISALPIAIRELARESAQDAEIAPLLTKLRQPLKRDADLSQQNEITKYSIEKECVLYGSRVFVPKKFRAQILQELHSGHLGITKMKGLARSHVYWPNLDKEIEALVSTCEPCQINARAVSVPPHPWEPATVPWQRVHIDYAGPFVHFNFLIIVDAFSKWPEVYAVPVSQYNGTSSRATIERLRDCFARFGYPLILVSDNGAQFTSTEFRQFCSTNGIKQMHSAPYHPSSNGQAERFVQTIKRALRIAIADKPTEPISEKLHRFLLAYRRAPLKGGGRVRAS